jgi:predicted TIM-barrel fold metal-dependent hydrolase
MTTLDRRTVLASLGTAMALPAIGAEPPRSSLIDVHNHYTPPEFYTFNERFIGPGGPPTRWDKSAQFADMDEAGTSVAVLSGFTSPTGGTVEDRRALARATNDFGAALVRERPNRFALFASLPLPDVDGCIAEMAYGLDTLKAVGVTIYTDSNDRWLGDPMFEPLHKEFDRRGVVVFVHPHSPACCHNLVKGVPDSFIEFATTTTRTIASLVFNGVTTRYPNIKFIFAHGGGAMPFLIERFLGGSQAEIVPGIVTHGQPVVPIKQPPGTALAQIRSLYYDTAQIANPVSLRALRQVVPVDRILFGTDFWYRSSSVSKHDVETSGVFTGRELEQVFSLNALALMPKLGRKLV